MITELAATFTDGNETDQDNLVNNAIMMELITGFAVACMAEAAVNTDYTIRSQSISAVDDLSDTLSGYTDNFDAVKQSGFSGDHNFFSLLFDTIARINESLLTEAFDLKAEKRYTLKHNSDAITECYNNYGTVNDETVSFFILSNKLIGNEFLELPAGREIVVYQ